MFLAGWDAGRSWEDGLSLQILCNMLSKPWVGSCDVRRVISFLGNDGVYWLLRKYKSDSSQKGQETACYRGFCFLSLSSSRGGHTRHCES